MTWQRYNKNLRKSPLLAEYFSFWTNSTLGRSRGQVIDFSQRNQRPVPPILNEQMPTPNGVNDLLLFLIVFFEIWRISRTRIKKWTFILCPYVCCYVTIRDSVLRVRPYITFTNIGKKLKTCKKI